MNHLQYDRKPLPGASLLEFDRRRLVPRKIVRGMLEHNGTEPDVIEDDDRFIVRLWKERRPA